MFSSFYSICVIGVFDGALNSNTSDMNTPQAYLEHINISVVNIDSTLDFLKTALPDFDKRGGGMHKGRRWIHFGTENSYLAINETDGTGSASQRLNHIGFVVDDVEQVAKRLIEAGYKRSYPKTIHPFRIRDYFEDQDQNEYEFVQYLSEDPTERNDYSDSI